MGSDLHGTRVSQAQPGAVSPEIKRFKCKTKIVAEGGPGLSGVEAIPTGTAYWMRWQESTETYVQMTRVETIYDPDRRVQIEPDDEFRAIFMPDNQRWEVLGFPGCIMWRFTLTEDMGDTTTNEASATLLHMDGTTSNATGIIVKDPTGMFGFLLQGSRGFCVEQSGLFTILQAECV